ncbi:MAG: PAS domain S-box protein [Pleurocapsa minor GSE-CHR-MK-17-07R]|nr:PAS domain S-box protein [Pleurocapsa minor GSE-CHR-MK 17-07R]
MNSRSTMLEDAQRSQRQRISTQRIKVSYLTALAVTAGLALFIFFGLLRLNNEQDITIHEINAYSTQRVDFQRVVLLSTLLLSQFDSDSYQSNYNEMTERIADLTAFNRERQQNTYRATMPAEALEILLDPVSGLDLLLPRFLELANTVMDETQSVAARTTAAQELVTVGPTIREQLSSIIQVLERINQEQVNGIQRLTIVFLVGIMLALLLEGVFIFRPMEKAIRTQQDLLFAEIEQRAQAEHFYREAKERYRTLVSHLPDMAVMVFDRDKRITLAGGPYLERTGFTREMVEGRLASDILPPDRYAALEPYYVRALAGEAVDFERSYKDTTYRAQYVPLFDSGGQVTGGLVVTEDITRMKQADAAVRASEERLRMVTDRAQDLICLLDDELKIVYANPAFEAILGYKTDELVGQPFFEYLRPEDRTRLTERRLAPGEDGTATDQDILHVRHRDGHYVSLEMRASLQFGRGDVKFSGTLVMRDIREREHMQQLALERERLQTALAKETELSGLKTRMMVRIAHEFRTPLAVIQLATENLHRNLDKMSPAQRDAKAATIASEIHSITMMLDDIGLAVNGLFVPASILVEQVDLAEVCSYAAAHIESEHYSPGRFKLDLKPVCVKADRGTLLRALDGIFMNALRFSSDGSPIYVTLNAVDGSAEITVHDNGIGILLDELPRIFEPFFRGSNIHEMRGLGLGLPIAKAAIEANGGTITVDSKAGAGTTVTISLPQATAEMPN